MRCDAMRCECAATWHRADVHIQATLAFAKICLRLCLVPGALQAEPSRLGHHAFWLSGAGAWQCILVSGKLDGYGGFVGIMTAMRGGNADAF
jgi:hypothetical protein